MNFSCLFASNLSSIDFLFGVASLDSLRVARNLSSKSSLGREYPALLLVREERELASSQMRRRIFLILFTCIVIISIVDAIVVLLLPCSSSPTRETDGWEVSNELQLLVYLWFVYKTAFSKPIISLFCLYFA
jgi:hypothetical protein